MYIFFKFYIILLLFPSDLTKSIYKMSSTSDEDISKGDTDDQNPMMVNLLASADRLLEIAEHGLTSNRNILDDPGGGFGGENNFEEDDKTQNNKPRSLEERLLELHIQESSKASVCANGLVIL